MSSIIGILLTWRHFTLIQISGKIVFNTIAGINWRIWREIVETRLCNWECTSSVNVSSFRELQANTVLLGQNENVESSVKTNLKVTIFIYTFTKCSEIYCAELFFRCLDVIILKLLQLFVFCCFQVFCLIHLIQGWCRLVEIWKICSLH